MSTVKSLKKNKRKLNWKLSLRGRRISQRNSYKARNEEKKKKKLKSVLEETHELRKSLNISIKPRIEEDQPLPIKTIMDIAMDGPASHDKGQSDVYRSIKH